MMQYKKYTLFALIFLLFAGIGIIVVERNKRVENNLTAQLFPGGVGVSQDGGGSNSGTGGSPTCEITASPAYICSGSGGSAALIWESLDTNADMKARIDPAFTPGGTVSLSGTGTVSPATTTTYVMTIAQMRSGRPLTTCQVEVPVLNCGSQVGSGTSSLPGGVSPTNQTSTDGTNGSSTTLTTSLTGTTDDTSTTTNPPVTTSVPPLYTLTDDELSSGK